MTTPGPNDPNPPRDAGNWATKVDRLAAPDDKSKVGYNITGKKVTGPQQGFGRLWQRTYSTNLGSVVGAQTLIGDWKVNFGDYWPSGSVFHNSLTGIEPGAVTPIEVGIAARGPKLATGILVIYADEESFTFMTPEGHMFAGMITFSAEEDAGDTRVEIRILIRPNDPDLGACLARRSSQGRRVLDGNADELGGSLRAHRHRGQRRDRVCRPQAALVELAERLAQLRHPFWDPHRHHSSQKASTVAVRWLGGRIGPA